MYGQNFFQSRLQLDIVELKAEVEELSRVVKDTIEVLKRRITKTT